MNENEEEEDKILSDDILKDQVLNSLPPQVKVKVKTFKCKKCGFIANSLSEFQYHRHACIPPKNVCSKCGKSIIGDEKTFKKHEKMCFITKSKAERRGKKCPKCGSAMMRQ